MASSIIVTSTCWTQPDYVKNNSQEYANHVANGYLTGACVWLQSLKLSDPTFAASPHVKFLLLISPDIQHLPLIHSAKKIGWIIYACSPIMDIVGFNKIGLIKNPRYAYTLGYKLQQFNPVVLRAAGVLPENYPEHSCNVISVDVDGAIVPKSWYRGDSPYMPFSTIADMISSSGKDPNNWNTMIAAYDTEPGGWGENGYSDWIKKHPHIEHGQRLDSSLIDFSEARFVHDRVCPPKKYRKCSTEIFALTVSDGLWEYLIDHTTNWYNYFLCPYYFDSEFFTAICTVIALDPRFIGARGKPHWSANWGITYSGCKPWTSPDVKQEQTWPDFEIWRMLWVMLAKSDPHFAAYSNKPIPI